MGDSRDPLEDWLDAGIEPLAPPPGAFERISNQARRRRARRAALSAAGIAVVIAAVAAAPGIATTLRQSAAGHPGRFAAAGAPPLSPRAAATGRGNGSLSYQSSRRVPGPASSLSPAGSGAAVPANFQPTSVTFVGTRIGAVIGQAGTPGHCATAYCTSLAGTSDYGSSWYGVSAPLTGPPDGSAGVGQVRFLNASNGWAFGPQLWVTHDGGGNWAAEQTYGMRVTDLEAAGNRAFALLATCAGSGPDYAADCSGFSLYTSQPGSDRWLPVPGPAAGLRPAQPGTAQAASASLVLAATPAGGRGYLLAPSGELLGGPLTGAAWTVVSKQAPCRPGAPGPGGRPGGALMAADSGRLVLLCASAASGPGSQAKSVVESPDGVHWSSAGPGPAAGIANSLAAQDQGAVIVLATDAGLFRSGNRGATWQLVQPGPAGAAAGQSGFGYVGMTSPLDGVALPADPGLHEVFITTDGGSTWQPRLVSPP